MAKFRTKVKTGWAFANIRLDREQRDHFTGWLTEVVADVMEMLVAVMLEGYKVSARYDDENQTWIATLTGTDETPFNASTSLSARHGDFDSALALVLYKHLVISDSGMWTDQVDSETWG